MGPQGFQGSPGEQGDIGESGKPGEPGPRGCIFIVRFRLYTNKKTVLFTKKMPFIHKINISYTKTIQFVPGQNC